MDTDPHNGADECQQFQTDQRSLVHDHALPFPLDVWVSRHLAATARHQGKVDPVDGETPIKPVDGQTHTQVSQLMGKPTLTGIIPGQGVRWKMLCKGVISKKSQVEWH